jgi:hypothetical protein
MRISARIFYWSAEAATEQFERVLLQAVNQDSVQLPVCIFVAVGVLSCGVGNVRLTDRRETSTDCLARDDCVDNREPPGGSTDREDIRLALKQKIASLMPGLVRHGPTYGFSATHLCQAPSTR